MGIFLAAALVFACIGAAVRLRNIFFLPVETVVTSFIWL
jgi:hypothetical protein